jgi:hypothetical protein
VVQDQRPHLQSPALPERHRLARPKRLRFEVFTLPGKLAIHESQLSVQVSAADARLQEIVTARQRLLTMRESTPRLTVGAGTPSRS